MSDLIDSFYDMQRLRRQAWMIRTAYRLSGDRLALLLARWLYRLRLYGEMNIPANGPCVLAMNHEAVIADAIVYLSVRRRRPDVLVFGWQHLAAAAPIFEFMNLAGEPGMEERALPVVKGQGLSAFSLYRAYKALVAGRAILVTVEGGLTWDGRLQYPLEPGAAWLALRTAAPVVPIRSHGGYDVQPYWNFKRMRLSGRISVHVGTALHLAVAPATGVEEAAIAAASDRIFAALQELAPVA